MRILAHRGCWTSDSEKNTLESIKRAIHFFDGFESDIRDLNGELVISHDIPKGKCLQVKDVILSMGKSGKNPYFAINVKSDGLANQIKKLLEENRIDTYFTFDMSLPQMLVYRNLGLRYFTRQSEYESEPLLYEEATGVWIDAFENDTWITPNLIRQHLSNNKSVCIVSPELHGRTPRLLWNRVKDVVSETEDAFLCTDRPKEARDFFGSNDGGH